MAVAVVEQDRLTKERLDMSDVHALAAELLATPRGQSESKDCLEGIEADDNLQLTAEIISHICDRGAGKTGGFLSYFFLLYELTKYVREKSQNIFDEEEKDKLLEYVEEGEEELWRIANGKEEREFLLSQARQ